jgi:ribosomal protein L37AE/L43A
METIQQNELVTYECPNCGYITRDKRDEKINCLKCQPDFEGWTQTIKTLERVNQVPLEEKWT